MKKLMTGLALIGAMMSSVAFAEGGSDRLVERMQARAQAQAQAKELAQEKARKETRDTAKSEGGSQSRGS
ncbi:hypothetical protein NP554_20960 [Pseudomonas asiatica]|uniref:Secreted protein n=1 Tax=Pseudomonas asiatica TaxID=2219225 RepID=A0A9X4DCQ5_9PSED|nr:MULTISPECIES: co-regulatory protein PtrA N-terminal domain-containing protein [Pseudomonas]AHD15256.1 hypothetical protein C163_16425 [Pseudomonas sp. FGI182]MDD2114254.1 hypothetical protein [Pseudomonas asiatica]